MKKEKIITVADLKRMCEALEECGYAEAQVWYRPYDSFDEPLKEGLWDTYQDPDGKKHIFLA